MPNLAPSRIGAAAPTARPLAIPRGAPMADRIGAPAPRSLRVAAAASPLAAKLGEPAARNTLLELDPRSPSFQANLERKYSSETIEVWEAITRVVTQRVVQLLAQRGMSAEKIRELAPTVLPRILDRVAQRYYGTPASLDGYAPNRLQNTEVFGDSGPSYRDIRQGDLGDCYFLAMLGGVVAADPDFVKEGIQPHTDARGDIIAGHYDVRFYVKDGDSVRETWVTVNDALLFDGNASEAYAQTVNSDGDDAWELWVALYEKAYAMLRSRSDDANSYPVLDRILGDVDAGYREVNEGGRGDEAYFALTGGPTDCASIDEVGEDLEAILALANDHSAVLMLGTKRPEGIEGRADSLLIDEGLPAGHAYQVLGTYTDRSDPEHPMTMVTLRNPWGAFEPGMEFDSAGNLLTNERFDGNDDGIFSISIDQVRSNFALLTGGA